MEDERKLETPLTAQKLVRQFEERLHEVENHLMTATPRMGPCYPMMVLSMGAGAVDLSDSVQISLKRLWPSFSDDIIFVKAERKENRLVFTRAGEDTELSDGDFGMLTARLFSVSTRFPRTNRLLLYAALDTSGFASADELSYWLDALDTFRRSIRATVPTMTMLSVLLNEDPNHSAIGRKVRGLLGAALSERENMPALMLVSNLRNDNRIDFNWTLCRRLVSAVVTVSNNEDRDVIAELFRAGNVMTASYALAEKPVVEISQICVEKLLGELKAFTPTEAGDLFGEDAAQTRERLGIGADGCFRVLDEYVKRHLPSYVPSGRDLKGLLRALPIQMPSVAYSDQLCEQTSSEVINDRTFGAWNCYLENVVRRARESLQSQAADIQDWEQAYYDDLRRNFHARELIELSKDLSKDLSRIRDFAKPTDHSSTEMSIQKTAEQRLKYLLSADADIRERLISQINQAGRQAAAFLDAWSELLSSAERLPKIVSVAENEEFIRYYQNQLDAFFNFNKTEIQKEFQNVSDLKALEAFFDKVMERIFGDKRLQEMFSGSFEDVGLMQIERTRTTLTNAPIYLNVDFSMESPSLSFLMLNVDERANSLYRNLKDSIGFSSFSEQTRFYHTGRASSAESLQIYRLNLYNMGSEEAEA